MSAFQPDAEGQRLDLSLHFRLEPDGTKRATVVLRDASGHSVAELTADSPEALNVLLAELVVEGFRPAGAPAPPPQRPVVFSDAGAATRVLGVDGYRHGWVGVLLGSDRSVEVLKFRGFDEAVAVDAEVIAVDIPIEPPERDVRHADSSARKFVGPRASSVFTTPPRYALEANDYEEANRRSRELAGKGVSQQAFALRKRILEVDELARADERVIEVHPEVCFCELAGVPLIYAKSDARGLEHRRRLLREAGIELPQVVAGVPEADLLDAGAAAWSAARYARKEAAPLPEGWTQRLGAIWR